MDRDRAATNEGRGRTEGRASAARTKTAGDLAVVTAGLGQLLPEGRGVRQESMAGAGGPARNPPSASRSQAKRLSTDAAQDYPTALAKKLYSQLSNQ